VAVFALKRERNPQSQKFGYEQLKSYLCELGDPTIPAYLVYEKPDDPPFEIERIRQEKEDKSRSCISSWISSLASESTFSSS
jgi:hypothetical protein